MDVFEVDRGRVLVAGLEEMMLLFTEDVLEICRVVARRLLMFRSSIDECNTDQAVISKLSSDSNNACSCVNARERKGKSLQCCRGPTASPSTGHHSSSEEVLHTREKETRNRRRGGRLAYCTIAFCLFACALSSSQLSLNHPPPRSLTFPPATMWLQSALTCLLACALSTRAAVEADTTMKSIPVSARCRGIWSNQL